MTELHRDIRSNINSPLFLPEIIANINKRKFQNIEYNDFKLIIIISGVYYFGKFIIFCFILLLITTQKIKHFFSLFLD
jgi:hypothetical protein